MSDYDYALAGGGMAANAGPPFADWASIAALHSIAQADDHRCMHTSEKHDARIKGER